MRDPACVRSYTVNFHSPWQGPKHSNIWDQLIYASSGVMTVTTDQGMWVVPPQRAVWVPSGLGHSVDVHGPLSMRTLHLRPSLRALPPTSCSVINVTPFLRELILHIIGRCPLSKRGASHYRLIGVLIEQLDVARSAPLELPAVSDERALRIAEILRRNPADTRTLRQLASHVGASSRTIERAFRAETGMGFSHWRRQCRLLFALQLLAAGEPVSNVSTMVGYENPSSFIAMFRDVFGVSPGRYFEAQSSLTGDGA